MLSLPIKKKWYDMITSGEKKEEYREIKPYYKARFKSNGLLDASGKPTDKRTQITLRNGYSRFSPETVATVHLDVGTGNPDWGAVNGKQYFILKIDCIDKIISNK